MLSATLQKAQILAIRSLGLSVDSAVCALVNWPIACLSTGQLPGQQGDLERFPPATPRSQYCSVSVTTALERFLRYCASKARSLIFPTER